MCCSHLKKREEEAAKSEEEGQGEEGSEEEGGKRRRSKSGKKRKRSSELQTAHGPLRFPLLYQKMEKRLGHSKFLKFVYRHHCDIFLIRMYTLRIYMECAHEHVS